MRLFFVSFSQAPFGQKKTRLPLTHFVGVIDEGELEKSDEHILNPRSPLQCWKTLVRPIPKLWPKKTRLEVGVFQDLSHDKATQNLPALKWRN